MMYYSLSQILCGLLYCLIFGFVLCVFSVITDVFFCFFESIISIPKDVIRHCATREKAREYLKKKKSFHSDASGTVLFVKDLLFSLGAGVLISFLFYVSADGQIRAYLLIAVLAVYITCKKTLGTLIYRIVQRLLKICIKLISSALIFTLLPFSFMMRKALVYLNKISSKTKTNLIGRKKRSKSRRSCAK